MGKFEKATGGASDREIKITRFFDAPRELVFRAWSDPAQLCKWWGPRGFTIATKSMDVRTGGAWVFDMRGPDGTIYPNRIVYTEIVPERKVAYEHTGEGETADAIFTAEISFEDEGRGTRVTMHSIFPSAAACNTVVEKYGAIEGGIETLERLADIVSQQSPATFTISREFDAPRAKLFELWIRPEHLGKWFGPKGFELEIKSADIRTGGSSLTRMKSPDGLVIWGKWIIREILPPERLIFIDCFSNESGGLERHPLAPTWPQHNLTTVTFEELGAKKTRVTVQWTPVQETAEELAMFAASHDSMRGGWTGTFDRLAECVAGLPASH
jgi:uncharacterized protein YndB with AHSA1/START domain